MGTMMNPHGTVGIPWGFSNGFQITWKRVKYSTFFVICFTGISLHYKLLNAHSNTVMFNFLQHK